MPKGLKSQQLRALENGSQTVIQAVSKIRLGNEEPKLFEEMKNRGFDMDYRINVDAVRDAVANERNGKAEKKLAKTKKTKKDDEAQQLAQLIAQLMKK